MMCKNCGEREAEVEVEIPISKTDFEVLEMCIECAMSEELDREHDGSASL